MSNTSDLFGSMVFSNAVMRERLPKETYQTLQKTIKHGKHLDINIANVVANAMKDWAIEKGATHFTHWFQPMTGVTAEKHESFISPNDEGRVIMEFSGKELVKGESDASSFPSGGLRATFEARGYTAWDATSYAFIKEKTLCIPTAFCSYAGDALDEKTPLLRSMEDFNREALRILKLFGSDATSVKTTVGPEQEYFLIDKSVYEKRPDLIYTGRTLFGKKPPKGQELEDHYYGTIKPRIKAFMEDLDEELWKLGISAKTEHNEVAPAQHELAPIFATTNIAADHNQLTMELLKKVASKHGLFCILHEKPFEGVNGSGKHNNWSAATNTGVNLLEPGDTPSENAQFLLFLSAVIKAVDEYQELLRISVATAANDHRLGASEAPPAIISMFVGDELGEILESIKKGNEYAAHEKKQMKVGVHTLPRIPKDNTDRNRTSPFAFTGNKFEFRALGSSASISEVNTVLNTIVAEELRQFADVLENTDNFEKELHNLIRKTIKEHERIIFNGNGYDESWEKEAAERGLLNLKTTPDAYSKYLDKKNVELFSSHGVFSLTEMKSRYEIALENYIKTINIEAETMIEMTRKQILPAVSSFEEDLASAISSKKDVSEKLSCKFEEETLEFESKTADKAYSAMKNLEKTLKAATGESLELAMYYKDKVIPAMRKLRTEVDTLETTTGAEYWPLPTYGEMLFSVKY